MNVPQRYPTASMWLLPSDLLVIALLLAAAAARGQDDPQLTARPKVRQAVVLNLDRSAEGELLARHLRSFEQWQWWPRQREQQLLQSVALSARIELPILEKGSLEQLLPPLVVVIHAPRGPDESSFRVIACDSESGLRLGSLQSPPITDAAALDMLAVGVRQALERSTSVQEVWSVPPLLSRDLGREHEGAGWNYREAMEQTLLDRPNAAAIEYEFAHLLDASRRAAGATSAIVRPAPAIILGQFRHTGDDEKRVVNLTLLLKFRDKEELDRQEDQLTPESALLSVRAFAEHAGKRLAGAPLALDLPGSEAAALAEHWETLNRGGDWLGAWRVAEARLVLDPEQPLLRCQTIAALGRLATQQRGRAQQAIDGMILDRPAATPAVVPLRPMPLVSARPRSREITALDEAIAGLNAYRRGLRHVDLLLSGDEQGRSLLTGDREDSRSFVSSLNAVRELTPMVQDRFADLRSQVNLERHTAAARIFYESARLGRLSTPESLRGESGSEALEIALRAILDTQDFPEAERRTRHLAEQAILRAGTGADVDGFLNRLAAGGNEAVDAAVESVRTARAAREAARTAARVARPALPAPAATDDSPAEIEFAEIPVQGDRFAGPIGASQLCLFVGNANLFCGYGQVLIMKEKGKLKKLWEDPEAKWSPVGWARQPAWACFDGKYAWIPLFRDGSAQRLVIVDPVAEKVIEWERDDGLPLMADESSNLGGTPALAVSGLGPGKVCVAGSSGRGWIAVAEYDPAQGKKAKVFFEARDQPNQADAREAQKTNLVFRPSYVYTVSAGKDGPLDSQRVIVGRTTGHAKADEHPLLVDPASGKVEIVQSALKSFVLTHATAHGDAIYWATREYSYDREAGKQRLEARVFRLGFPDFEEQVIINHGEIKGRQFMPLQFGKDAVHFVADPWLIAASVDQPVRQLRGKLPSLVDQLGDHWKLVPSPHYDWIIYTTRQGRAFGVTLKLSEFKSK
jgi:hypothetical protein